MSKQQYIANELIQAYMDYRRFHYVKIHEVLSDNGLLHTLNLPRSLDEIMEDRKYVTDRKSTLKAMLDALVKLDILESQGEGTYRLIKIEGSNSPDSAKVKMASGDQAIQQHSGIAGLAVRFLEGTINDIEFSHEFHIFWKALLEAPFYAQGREKSAQEVALKNGTVLDMASGQGHALVELSKLVGENGKVFGIEYSDDHIEISKNLINEKGCRNISVRQGDLNDGLPYENEQFDGILFIGAFHFITKREHLISEISRVARRGAPIAIGNIYSNLDTFDRPFMDLIFSMIQPRALPVDIELFQKSLTDAGLSVYEHVNVGCNGWYLLKKDQ